MWEDEKNKDGGRWVLQAGKKNMIGSPGNEQPALDLYWLEVNKKCGNVEMSFYPKTGQN